MSKYKDQHATTALVIGTICGLLRILQSDEFIKTIVLTAVSATVSYGVSFLLQRMTKRFKK